MLEEIIQLTNELKAKETFIHIKAKQDFGFERPVECQRFMVMSPIACEQGL